MSWIFTSSSSFDEPVEKATSEMLPLGQEDMALNLDICDRIRSKQVPPKDAMRALKKRLLHKNPNVQLLALKLADVCVKNGGAHFLAEVASREFVDTLVGMLNNTATNQEVRTKTLSAVQSWATAFKARSELNYMVDTYNALKTQGYAFPAQEKTGAIMIDTAAPPDWSDSDVCDRCRTLFTLTNRKHHCRNCGKTFCQPCSSRNVPLLHLGISQDVRVCEGCFQKLGGGGSSSEPTTPVATAAAGSAATSKEDEELQRAIALSLLEKEKESSSTKKPERSRSPPPRQRQPASDSEEDPDLAAAIAASLREAKLNESASSGKESSSASMYPSAPSAASSSKKVTFERAPAKTAPSEPVYTPTHTAQDGLSATETQNIALFHQLLEKMDADASGAASAGIAGDRELRQLYESMSALHPKLVKNIEECVEKHRVFMDLHEKLTNGVRIYDRLVEERARQMSAAAAAAAYPPPQQQYYGGYAQPPPNGYAPPPQHHYAPHQQQPQVAPPPAPAPSYYGAPPPQQQQQQQPQHGHPAGGYYGQQAPPPQEPAAAYHRSQSPPHQQQHQQQQYPYGPQEPQAASNPAWRYGAPPPASTQSPPPAQQQQQQAPPPPVESKPLIEF